MTRDERQWSNVYRWVYFNYNAVILAFTGYGKTYVGKKAIEAVECFKYKPKVLIVVPGVPVKIAWDKLFPIADYTNIDIKIINGLTINEIDDISDYYYDLIIYDEIHNYVRGDIFHKALNMKCEKKLGLTAMLTDELEDLLTTTFNLPVADVVSAEEAEQEGYVSPFQIFNIAIPLTESEQIIYKNYNIILGKFMQYFGRNLYKLTPTIVTEIAKEHEIEQGMVWGMAKKLKDAIANRNDLLASCCNKVLAARYFIDQLPDKKIITFNTKIEVAESLVGNNEISYHSKSGTPKKRREILDDFLTGKYQVVHTAKSLDEGFDDSEIGLGIVLSWTKNVLQTYQRVGRVVRNSDVVKTKYMIFLYAEGTADEKSLSLAQEKIAPEYITWARNTKQVLTIIKNL